MKALICPKCAEDPGFIREPIIDDVFITSLKKATCRECGTTFDFHYGQVDDERQYKAAIYEGCDQNVDLINRLKAGFFGSDSNDDDQRFSAYYNLAVFLKYGNMRVANSMELPPVVLTLWEPYASLYAAGLKKLETRPRATSYAGTMLIHTAKNPPIEMRDLCQTEPFASALTSIGIKDWKDFRNGAIIGAVEQYLCVKIIDPTVAKTLKKEVDLGKVMIPPPDPEFSFGDYRPNRFAWFGAHHRQLEDPIEYTNGQGYYLRLRENLDYSSFKFKNNGKRST